MVIKCRSKAVSRHTCTKIDFVSEGHIGYHSLRLEEVKDISTIHSMTDERTFAYAATHSGETFATLV